MARSLGAAGEGGLTGADGAVTRIVSGTWGGRRLATPGDRRVRPTAERVREAWLNILRPGLAGARILDLFAGTGALGLEALSRGAEHATFVERHPDSLAVLRANIATLGATTATTVVRGDAITFVNTLGDGAFDIALADPPFDSDFAEQLATIWSRTRFARILAVEHPRSLHLGDGVTRRWGDIAVTFFGTP